VREVTGRKDFELYGAGRTDAGVHAIAQVAHLDVSTNLPPEQLRRRLNDELPADINLLHASVVPHRFHARHDAAARRYVYQIARRRTAFAKPFVWWVKDSLDVTRMRAAAAPLVGMRDFAAFAETRDEKPRSTLVLVDRLEVAEGDDLVLVGIEGSHFLWRMVRRIVGVLVEAGRGALAPEEVESLLLADSALPARLTAPASGLFLERVYYKGDSRNHALKAPTPFGMKAP
jgi:tRNA pseudouridine38-40 synthase